jgi:hypothetical protein
MGEGERRLQYTGPTKRVGGQPRGARQSAQSPAARSGVSKFRWVASFVPLVSSWLAVTTTAIAAPSTVAETVALDATSRACQECHETEDLWYRDPSSGETISLSISEGAYLASSHGTVGCIDCHDRGYARHPHTGPQLPRFLCVGCHQDDSTFQDLHLDSRKRELASSVHGGASADPLECHDCHDPHRFRLINGDSPVTAQIAASNGICLDCHGPSRAREHGRARGRFEDLSNALRNHQTIPNARDHFRKVKCVACHSDFVEGTTHLVNKKEEALTNCTESCHREDAPVLRSLYGPRTEGGAGYGRGDPLAANAYVIGATRTPLLDALSQLGFGLLMLAIAAHSIARLVLARRIRRQRGRR